MLSPGFCGHSAHPWCTYMPTDRTYTLFFKSTISATIKMVSGAEHIQKAVQLLLPEHSITPKAGSSL